MRNYTVYFTIVPPGGKPGPEKKQVMKLENPNDIMEAARALKQYGYPDMKAIRIIRIE
jgi:type III secretory pathway lipoprotein EscJ